MQLIFQGTQPPQGDPAVAHTTRAPAAVNNFTLNNGNSGIGDTLLNYGGGDLWNGWNASDSLLECSFNTEIAVHDSGTRLAYAIYYEGNANNQITIGQDMGWGAIKNIVICGNIVGNSSWITNLNYNTIPNAPDLTVYAIDINLKVLASFKPPNWQRAKARFVRRG